MDEGIRVGRRSIDRRSDAVVLGREAGISAVINGVLSALFYVGVFGMTVPAAVPAIGADCLPQAFMVSLMGSLVPALLLRRTTGGRVSAIIVRALLIALGGVLVAGGTAWMISRGYPLATLAPATALAGKVAFGAILGAIVTPIALLPLLRRGSRADAG